MASNEVQHYYVGAEDLPILVDTGRDLSGVESVVFDVLKPNQARVEWMAAPYPEGGSNTEAVYVTIKGDFDVAGTYSLHAVITRNGGKPIAGNEILFRVENLHPKRS